MVISLTQRSAYNKTRSEDLDRTAEYFKALIDFGHQLDLKYLVFGSPNQRTIDDSWDYDKCYKQGVLFFQEMGDYAADYDIIIAFEPLGPQITNFGGTFQQGLKILEDINHPQVKLHLDTSAMFRDPDQIIEIIRKVPLEEIAYVHLNDPNKLGPGMGDLEFAPIMDAFIKKDYRGWFSIESFDKSVAGERIASESLNNLKNIFTTLIIEK